MVSQRMRSQVLTWALIAAPSLGSVGCGDDDGGGDVTPDTGISDASIDAGEGGLDGSGPDGSGPDASAPDSATSVTGDTWGYTSAKRLVSFERASGKVERSVTVAVPAGETIWGVDVRPADGTVVALSSAGKLYTIDPASGAVTLKSTLTADPADTSDAFMTLAGTSYGVDFNPVVDRLRIVSNTGQNLRVNVDTGRVITDGALNPANTGIAAAAYTNSFAAACRTALYVIDATARKLLLQNPPNDGRLSELGSLGEAAIGTVHGFDIVTSSGGSNTALVAATAADGERVATLDLTTGALGTARVVALNAGETLESIFALPPASAPAQAPGELLATTVSNKVVSFNRAAPGKLCTSAAITGLGAGENVVGADMRPADGNLYVLTSAGKLYTIAPLTAVATLKSTLVKATEGDAFSALAGTEFAVAFNPVPDRLRVISNTGVNLRINVDDGKVTTDSPISQTSGTPGITAAAYTNAFAGARSTTLWALDTTADSLVRIGGDPADGAACPNATNPNCGVSTTVQPLGITGDVSGIDGFDIEATTGAALAALVAGDATTSTLYTIQPNGDPSATPPVPVSVALGTIGGGERVRSLTFAATPKLTVWAVTSDDKLVSFAPTTPQTLVANAAITGLQANETLVGVDVRPLDGRLYGVGTTGRLYRLEPDGRAIEVVALTPATGSTFTTLPVASYGFDFNPAADALRLVSANGDNLRILPSARMAGVLGATFADTSLDTGGALAAGYTSSFAGATSTTLYVIGGGALYRQGGVGGTPSPNLGALTLVGALGVGSAMDIGFDIAGGNDGLALAAIEQEGAPTLFVINLRTGVATALNATGNTIAGATGAVRGLALELK